MATFGLHFGGTNLTLAICKNGQAEILANSDGHRSTPAVIACRGDHYVVGVSSALTYRPDRDTVVDNIRSIIGLKSQDPKMQDFICKSECKIKVNEEDVIFKFKESREDEFTVSQLIKLLLQKIKEIARSRISEESIPIVLAVPVYYESEQILALRTAAEEVGFHVLRFVKEPCATALAYKIGQTDIYENGYYLVFRIGGKSADVSILRVDGGLYRILAYRVEPSFGGENFSNIISECLIKEFEKKWNVQVPKDNKRAFNKFLKAAEQCKQILSLSSIANHFIESAYDGIDYQCTISRTKFEMLCNKLLEKCVDLIDATIIEAALIQSDITKVILCGGSSHILKLQEIIKARFNIPVCADINPGEVIAIGAAIQGGFISRESPVCVEKTLPVLCSPCGICVSVRESDLTVNDVQVIVPCFCPLPFRKRIPLRDVSIEGSLVSIYVHQLLQSDKESNIQPIAKLMLADLLKDDDNRFLIDVEYKRAHKFTTILVLSIQRADSLQSCSYSLVEVILVVWSFLVVTTKANLLFPMLRYDSDGEIEIELTETISKKFTSVTIGTEKTK